MQKTMLMSLFVGVGIAATSCKDKGKPEPVAGAVAPGSAAAGAAEPAKPAIEAAKLAEGEVKTPGCFAWSATKKAAACLAGYTDYSEQIFEPEWQLQLLGSTSPADKLGGKVDAAAAARVNDVLAKDGYQSLAGTAEKISDKAPVTVNRVEFKLASKESNAAEHQARTRRYTLTAKCGGADVVVHEDTGEEGYALEVALRAAGDEHVLVDLFEEISREGDFSKRWSAVVLDTKTCKLAKS